MAKYGLEPDELEELAVQRFYKIIFECNESEDFDMKPLSSRNIRQRIQKCIKKFMARQNKSNPNELDKRRPTANESFDLIHGGGDITNISSPHQWQEDTSGKQGVTKATKQYHGSYHEAQYDLFIRENILTDEYAINNGGRLERNGMEMSLQDFIDFIKENLTVRRLRELLVIGPTQTSGEDPEKQKFIDNLVVAFKILNLRYYNEMTIPKDLKVEREMQNWQNHVDVIVEFAVYVAVLDEIYHVKWRKCGIEDIKDTAYLPPTNFPLSP